jgi:hypothetical protein
MFSFSLVLNIKSMFKNGISAASTTGLVLVLGTGLFVACSIIWSM